MSLTGVQRWVLSTLATITILHLSAGLVVAAYYATPTSSQVGLLGISAAFGVLAFEAALLIHHRRPVSPLLLLGVLPALVGAFLVFGRG